MAKSPFEVDLTQVDIPSTGLTPEAEKAWGFKVSEDKEVKVAKEEMVEGVAVAESSDKPNMTVDSPRDLWDALGHIQLSLTVKNIEGIKQSVSACVELWDALRDDFSDVIEATKEEANRISSEQVGFITQLCEELEEDEPENLGEMSKAEASTLIRDLMKKRDTEARPARRVSSTRPTRTASRSEVQPSRGGDRGRQMSNPHASITNPQLDLIEKICGRNDMDVPEDVEEWTKKEASDWIQEHTEQRRRR